MSQTYFQEYAKKLAGKRVCIACREEILREHLDKLIPDIRFLTRQGIQTTLFHNLPDGFTNQDFLETLKTALAQTNIVRITAEDDFYAAVLERAEIGFKLIFIERDCLIDQRNQKINTLTTEDLRRRVDEYNGNIANINFKEAMHTICTTIEQGRCERLHILPAEKQSIRRELFTVEGCGTMIANNFHETFRQAASEEDLAIINRILSMYKKAGFLKPRSKDYIRRHRRHFFVTEIDAIIVGCVERKIVDEITVELGALAIATRFRNQRVGVYTVNAFITTMAEQGYSRFISLTNNPKLQNLFKKLGFSQQSPTIYQKRQKQSPNTTMFFKNLRGNDSP
ncbi:MAG: hypothetical protein CSA20_08435 [Deltaproteobacteria bacterium]|nr:MAG: hypothetical protein CSB23_04430 [Deltaproteobacteria bacterium]PIE72354.1 MAG: hypothetical protein CSA20_08435 [Deltaproteobacteria bacterium]